MSRPAHPPAAAPDTSPLPAALRAAGASACVLSVAVQPGARQTQAQGWHDGALRIRLAAQPIEGQANAALTEWLARELGLAKRAVRLRRGASARQKQLEIDLPAATVAAWLQQVLPAG